MTKNLIPQQRQDRNGKVVTRWVKEDDAASGKSNIPAPGVSNSQQEQMKSNLVDDVHQRLWGGLNSFMDEELGNSGIYDEDEIESERSRYYDAYPLPSPEKLQEYSLNTLKRMQEYVYDPEFAMVVLKALAHGADEHKLGYYTELYPHANEICTDPEIFSDSYLGEKFIVLHEAVEGAHHYSHLGYEPPKDILDATNQERQQLLNLSILRFELESLDLEVLDDDVEPLRLVKDHTGSEELNVHKINDDELVKLVLEQDDAKPLFELMWERESVDPEFLRSILESDSSALKSGHL